MIEDAIKNRKNPLVQKRKYEGALENLRGAIESRDLLELKHCKITFSSQKKARTCIEKLIEVLGKLNLNDCFALRFEVNRIDERLVKTLKKHKQLVN